MTTLTAREMQRTNAGGFWGGLACGLAITTAFVAATSPEPFGKLALLAYGGAVIGCASSF